MFEKHLFRSLVAVLAIVATAFVSVARADSFGTGDNTFEIDFVTVSGGLNPASTSVYGFVADDFRMSVYETTNDQWDKFRDNLGMPVTGYPPDAYAQDFQWVGTDVPIGRLSWYEAAQFVNWLNTSTGNQAAYHFKGTQGTSDYNFSTWPAAQAAGGTNLYRHKDAHYFLPTEDEWVKAAYFNGTTLQNHATRTGPLTQGDGTNGEGWNYRNNDGQFATFPEGPWSVGSGSEELNGTYDMMGNIHEWTESPVDGIRYDVDSARRLRGGSYYSYPLYLHIARNWDSAPSDDFSNWGFRVASVAEPAIWAEPVELIVNGGFEVPDVTPYRYHRVTASAGELTGWDVVSGNVDLVDQSFVTGLPHEGAQWLDLTGDVAGMIEQTFATEAGLSYTLSFQYANNTGALGTVEARVTVTGDDPLLRAIISHSDSTREDMDYQLFSDTFIADSSSATLRFESFSGGGSGIALDSVSVIPEPGSIALLLCGALTLLGFALRKRRCSA